MTTQELNEILERHTKYLRDMKDEDRADLSGVDLTGFDLHDVDLTSADLSGAIMRRADLTNAILIEANMEGADMMGAVLRSADLYSANLYGANLSKTNLRGAYMNRAEMSCANLHGSDLREADLSDTSLYNADLCGARIAGVNLKGARLTARILQLGPIGIRKEYAFYNASENRVEYGHWNNEKGGTLEEFEEYIEAENPKENEGRLEYRHECLAAIAYFKTIRAFELEKVDERSEWRAYDEESISRAGIDDDPRQSI